MTKPSRHPVKAHSQGVSHQNPKTMFPKSVKASRILREAKVTQDAAFVSSDIFGKEKSL